jgi:hypothetical protein
VSPQAVTRFTDKRGGWQLLSTVTRVRQSASYPLEELHADLTPAPPDGNPGPFLFLRVRSRKCALEGCQSCTRSKPKKGAV